MALPRSMRHTQYFNDTGALRVDDNVRLLLNRHLAGVRLAPWPTLLGKVREGTRGARNRVSHGFRKCGGFVGFEVITNRGEIGDRRLRPANPRQPRYRSLSKRPTSSCSTNPPSSAAARPSPTFSQNQRS